MIEPRSFLDGKVTLYSGDNRDVLKQLPDNSIDSICTDPPYALVSIQKRFGKPGSKPAKDVYARGAAGFMGKTWDTGEVAFSDVFWAECLRVLKPGGHVVAFSGTRTYHRMAVAIEDAGFEIRDRIRFDQSFDTKFGPLFESLNDEQRGALLELLNDYGDGGSELAWAYGSGFPKSHNQHDEWEGWGTALKPAWEPIALARKPLDGTVAENLAKWGVGALNIDGCRVETDENLNGGAYAKTSVKGSGSSYTLGVTDRVYSQPPGRWPANIVHDGSDEVVGLFPERDGATSNSRSGVSGIAAAGLGARPVTPGRGDSGSAARFFYCAKASRKDRDEGLEHMPKRAGGMVSNTSGQHITRRDEGYKPEPRANTHPTVKPTALMQWLCRLVTPPGGVILDPFMGSGSTGKAALLEGFKFIGIEKEDEYMPIAEARILAALRPVAAVAQPAAANDNLPLFSAPAQAGAA